MQNYKVGSKAINSITVNIYIQDEQFVLTSILPDNNSQKLHVNNFNHITLSNNT